MKGVGTGSVLLRSSSIALLLSLLAVNILVFLPALDSGYYADDAFNSVVRGKCLETGKNIFSVVAEGNRAMLKYNARFFPLSGYSLFIHFLAPDVLAYKIFLLAAMLLSLACYFNLLAKLTGSILLPTVTLLLTPLFLQLRYVYGWDPILAFDALIPLCAILLFTSLTLFTRYLDTGSRKDLWLALLLYVAACMLYEITYSAFLCYLLLAALRRRPFASAVRAVAPFGLIVAFFLMLQVVIRHYVLIPDGNPYAPNFAPLAVLRTLLIHLVGGLPLSYFFFDPDSVFRNSSGVAWPGVVGYAALTVLAGAFIARASYRRVTLGLDTDASIQNWPQAVLLGLSVAFMAPALIAFSPKYQRLSWGAGYLPVFLCSLGLAAVAAGLGARVFRTIATHSSRAARRFVALAAVFWCVVYGVNTRNSILVIRGADEVYFDARRAVSDAIKHGLLSSIPAESTLLLEGSDFNTWNMASFYAQETGRVFRVLHAKDRNNYTQVLNSLSAMCRPAADQTECDVPESASLYFLQARALGKSFGFVILAKVDRIVYDDEKLMGVLASRAQVFVRTPAAILDPYGVGVAGTEFGAEGDNKPSRFWMPQWELTVLRAGRDWQRISMRRDKPFDAMALTLFPHRALESSQAVGSPAPAKLQLQPMGEKLVHRGYVMVPPNNAYPLTGFSMRAGMSIECLVRVAPSQVGWATLLDNRQFNPGHAFEGLFIEQVGSNLNRFQAGVGAGDRWAIVGQFDLRPNALNHLLLQVTTGEVRVFLNGVLVGKQVVGTSLRLGRGPLLVGNWVRGGRRFNGSVEEIAIYRGIKTETHVKNMVASIMQQMPSKPRVDWRSGCYDEERYPPNITQRWCSSAGEFVLVNPTPNTMPATVEMDLYTNIRERSKIQFRSASFSETFETNLDGRSVALQLQLPPGETPIHFSTNVPRHQSNDGRVLHFRIINFHIIRR